MLLSKFKLQKFLYLIKFSTVHVHKNETSARSVGVLFTFTIQYAELLHKRCAHTLFSIQKFNKQMHREDCTFLISINETTFTCVPRHHLTF